MGGEGGGSCSLLTRQHCKGQQASAVPRSQEAVQASFSLCGEVLEGASRHRVIGVNNSSSAY